MRKTIVSLAAVMAVVGAMFIAAVPTAGAGGTALVDKVRNVEGVQAVSGCTACNECVATLYTPGGTRCVLTQEDNPALNTRPACP